MGSNDKIAYWIAIASYDLGTAKALLTAKRYLYVGFMCHQTIEKTLKACHVRKKPGVPPFTHNLVLLAKEAGVFDIFSEQQRGLIDMLQPLNIESRYPSYREKIGKTISLKSATELYSRTRVMYLWLKNQFLKKQDPSPDW